MLTKQNLDDLSFVIMRSHQDITAIIVDAWIGDLFLGQRIFYRTTPYGARLKAINIIEQHGSLH